MGGGWEEKLGKEYGRRWTHGKSKWGGRREESEERGQTEREIREGERRKSLCHGFTLR